MKIPDGKTLKDVLPPQTYEKWLALRLKYVGEDDDVEKLRPALALGQLRNAALRRHGMQGGPSVQPPVSRTIEVKNPGGMLKGSQGLQLSDVECFVSDLDRVEPDVERLKLLANAWSLGDTAKLRSLFRQVNMQDVIEEGCARLTLKLGNALMSTMYEQGTSAEAVQLKQLMEDWMWHEEQATLQAQRDWLVAAQTAMEKNKSTFAVLPLADVFRPDGHLEKLRALGYGVEEPR
jgi:hypothetical protein